ncbi:antimicrobial peptide NK-lysin-like protein [Labeo rohita]|uniref:Antimicrobial peptide NK-lysin-like protein n=1 Tax=Labeo rohita TaxID=84645 RepID=A0A498MDL2_LABRO|nr:antimicrobial peptide NK-lysin-like protein [Labeo rohita]RXN19289.1 antimicrobial peptide NK-lysin-like protein [Labeo rohita]
MLRNIFLVTLLVYAVCATHWEIREVGSAEDQDEEIYADDMMKEQIFLCSACKTLIAMVKKRIPSNATAVDIKAKLNNFCGKMWLLKRTCLNIVQKHLHGLVDELMKNDGPNAVCTKIHVCK